MSPTLEDLLALVGRRRFDVVGLSISCERNVPMLARALRGVQQASCNTQMITMLAVRSSRSTPVSQSSSAPLNEPAP